MPQTFVVGGDSIIDIPPYHTYEIEILEDAAIYNYGGEYNLQACLEDLETAKKNNPEAFSDKEQYLNFLRKYDVYATDISYMP